MKIEMLVSRTTEYKTYHLVFDDKHAVGIANFRNLNAGGNFYAYGHVPQVHHKPDQIPEIGQRYTENATRTKWLQSQTVANITKAEPVRAGEGNNENGFHWNWEIENLPFTSHVHFYYDGHNLSMMSIRGFEYTHCMLGRYSFTYAFRLNSGNLETYHITGLTPNPTWVNNMVQSINKVIYHG